MYITESRFTSAASEMVEICSATTTGEMLRCPSDKTVRHRQVFGAVYMAEPLKRFPKFSYLKVQSKADISQLNIPHGRKWKQKNYKVKTDMLRSIGKQSGESVQSVLKKKRKATVGSICKKRF